MPMHSLIDRGRVMRAGRRRVRTPRAAGPMDARDDRRKLAGWRRRLAEIDEYSKQESTNHSKTSLAALCCFVAATFRRLTTWLR